MGRYLIDNNAISNFFSGRFSQKGMDFMAEVIDSTPTISVITKIEALSWISSDKSKEQIVKAFIEDALVLDLSSDVVAQCIVLRRSRKIKIPDAIIAATAIIHNLSLITNDAHFANIGNLPVIDPNNL
jgi:predicted nucleic acid-binding protein